MYLLFLYENCNACSTLQYIFYPFLKVLHISVPCKPNKPYNTFHCMFPAEKLIACMFSQTRVLWKEFLHIVSVFSFIRGMSSAYFFQFSFRKREKKCTFSILLFIIFSAQPTWESCTITEVSSVWLFWSQHHVSATIRICRLSIRRLGTAMAAQLWLGAQLEE